MDSVLLLVSFFPIVVILALGLLLFKAAQASCRTFTILSVEDDHGYNKMTIRWDDTGRQEEYFTRTGVIWRYEDGTKVFYERARALENAWEAYRFRQNRQLSKK